MSLDVDDREIDWRNEDASHDRDMRCSACRVGLHELCDMVDCECHEGEEP
jgi:hypothetical protein